MHLEANLLTLEDNKRSGDCYAHKVHFREENTFWRQNHMTSQYYRKKK